uniref:TF-B3 domain-containing protein n=1 Tax=Lotus japonicus TaxID=34305 RepID=I3SEP5_LOTJA|nr:unknown [Lotus japonicus]
MKLNPLTGMSPLLSIRLLGRKLWEFPQGCLMHKPETVEVELDGDYQRMEDWTLLWTPDRPTQCMFGHGWYEFAVEKKLRESDLVTFMKHDQLVRFLVFIT